MLCSCPEIPNNGLRDFFWPQMSLIYHSPILNTDVHVGPNRHFLFYDKIQISIWN